MTDEALLELVRRADPVHGVGEPPVALLNRVLASPRSGAVRPRRLSRRRTVLLACAVAAAIVPLTALAAVNHWWFLQTGAGLPRPGQQPTVVTRGSWSGHRWTLVAYPSKHFAGTTNGPNGLCWGVTFSGPAPPSRYGNMFYGGMPHGVDDGMACGSLVGIRKPKPVADLKEVGDPIPTAVVAWSLSAAHGYPSWISGVVVPTATHVAVRWPARKAQPPGILASPPVVVRAATFPARVAGYRVRLFAARLPAELSRHTRTASVTSLPSRISGTNRSGRVVACDWAAGVLPLSSCRP
jgi:hypothetical protein